MKKILLATIFIASCAGVYAQKRSAFNARQIPVLIDSISFEQTGDIKNTSSLQVFRNTDIPVGLKSRKITAFGEDVLNSTYFYNNERQEISRIDSLPDRIIKTDREYYAGLPEIISIYERSHNSSEYTAVEKTILDYYPDHRLKNENLYQNTNGQLKHTYNTLYEYPQGGSKKSVFSISPEDDNFYLITLEWKDARGNILEQRRVDLATGKTSLTTGEVNETQRSYQNTYYGWDPHTETNYPIEKKTYFFAEDWKTYKEIIRETLPSGANPGDPLVFDTKTEYISENGKNIGTALYDYSTQTNLWEGRYKNFNWYHPNGQIRKAIHHEWIDNNWKVSHHNEFDMLGNQTISNGKYENMSYTYDYRIVPSGFNTSVKVTDPLSGETLWSEQYVLDNEGYPVSFTFNDEVIPIQKIDKPQEKKFLFSYLDEEDLIAQTFILSFNTDGTLAALESKNNTEIDNFIKRFIYENSLIHETVSDLNDRMRTETWFDSNHHIHKIRTSFKDSYPQYEYPYQELKWDLQGRRIGLARNFAAFPESINSPSNGIFKQEVIYNNDFMKDNMTYVPNFGKIEGDPDYWKSAQGYIREFKNDTDLYPAYSLNCDWFGGEIARVVRTREYHPLYESLPLLFTIKSEKETPDGITTTMRDEIEKYEYEDWSILSIDNEKLSNLFRLANTSSGLKLINNSTSEGDYTITDTSGRIVIKEKLITGINAIPENKVLKGIFILNISTARHKQAIKFIR